MTLTICDVSHIQCGDLVKIGNKTKTVIAIEGPDRIGTYEVYLVDEYGNKTQEIVTGAITLAR